MFLLMYSLRGDGYGEWFAPIHTMRALGANTSEDWSSEWCAAVMGTPRDGRWSQYPDLHSSFDAQPR